MARFRTAALRVACLDDVVVERLTRLARGHPVVLGRDPGRAGTSWHVAITIDPELRAEADVLLGSPSDLDHLWASRLRPWAENLRDERRAPRARSVVLEEHREDWHRVAGRLLQRLTHAAEAEDLTVLHADHIGSTSVCGLRAKPLLDVQLVIGGRLPPPSTSRALGTRAGLLAITGVDYYAIDRHDRRHPEHILVDADPSTPVNVHLHAHTSPVWQETLAFRNWLRASPSARADYETFKRRLADGNHVDDYSRAKRAWVNHAVQTALEWSRQQR